MAPGLPVFAAVAVRAVAEPFAAMAAAEGAVAFSVEAAVGFITPPEGATAFWEGASRRSLL